MNQMRQELQNELTTANQLISLISVELQQIINLTNPGGDFEANIKQNADLLKTLAKYRQLDITKLPIFTREQVEVNIDINNGE